MIAHRLNRSLDVWRAATAVDEGGGIEEVTVNVGTVRCKVDQPSAAEQMVAAQFQAKHTHTVYVLPGADVQRGDELRTTGETYRVIATMVPSRAIYLKALTERIEVNPDG